MLGIFVLTRGRGSGRGMARRADDAMTTSAGLTISGLHKRFGQTAAVDGIDLEIGAWGVHVPARAEGERHDDSAADGRGIRGPDNGSIHVNGTRINDAPAHRRNMGMVFQAYSLFPTMTARQNIEFGLRLRGLSKRDRAARATEALALVACRTTATATPTNCLGENNSALRLPVHWHLSPRFSSWTSRCPRSTPR